MGQEEIPRRLVAIPPGLAGACVHESPRGRIFGNRAADPAGNESWSQTRRVW